MKPHEIQPTAPTVAESEHYFRGRIGSQTVRMHKTTMCVERWYWGNGGHWGHPEKNASGFVCTPTLRPTPEKESP